MRLLPLLLLLSGCGMADRLWSSRPPLPVAEADPPGLAASPDGTPMLRLAWPGGQALAQLIQQQGETRLWRSAGGVVVATDGARITATAGLAEILSASRLDGPDPLEEPLALAGRPVTLRRQLDLMRADRAPEGMRFGLALRCRLSAQAEGEALLVREACQGAGRAFTNRYWADPESGGIWRSEQWIGAPGMMVLEVVTPPSS